MKQLLKDIKKNKICYLYIAPFFILFTIFTVLPVIVAIALSFTSYNILQPAQFIGLQNYAMIFFEDEIFIKAVVNTLTMALVIGPFSYIGALIVAWVLNELNRGVRTALVFMIYAPSISGGALMIWQLLLSGDELGYVNSLLLQLGFIDTPIQFFTDTEYMLMAVIIVTMWTSMGTQFLSFVAALQGLDQSLYEAGAIDGIRNRWQELWYVTLPQMKPQLLFGAVISITGAFSVGSVGASLCGNPSTDYAVHTVINFMSDYSGARYEYGAACAVAVILFVAIVASNELIKKLLNNLGR